ncbi:MAG: hypothetical protein IJ527_00450 [Prevotella sp.]|nr:hypothetical protein [Prevotella sp.]
MKSPTPPLSDIGYRVQLYPDGKYRWIYEVKMLTNPSILFDVYKVLAISFIVVWLFNITIISCAGSMSLDSLWGATWVLLLILLGLFVLGYVAYFFVAWYYGWKYIVVFTMDEHEICHEQAPQQVKKARKLSALTALAGAASGRPGMVGQGLMTATHTKSTSVLANVKHVVPRRWMNLIKVNQLFDHNRIFVPDEDFDFVLDFLRQHCPKAKRR